MEEAKYYTERKGKMRHRLGSSPGGGVQPGAPAAPAMEVFFVADGGRCRQKTQAVVLQ
jgi:hypothetical protein